MNAKEYVEKSGAAERAPAAAIENSGQGLYKSIKEKYKNAKIYKIIASRVSYAHKGDLLVETDDEILLFASDVFDENFYGSWTDNKEEYDNDEYIDMLVKEVE